ncbi:phosphatidylinositol 4-phosphate 5-kinase-like protein 1 [Ptychodera flava]|uniref:phosphatidylinositol 4-phosphate 5-kinase-like protein 1 n=1 Tax=Ptychodera flava TaxID=63121 RepID=UPI00396A53C4
MADDSEAIKCAICGELIGSQAGNPAVSATESETDSAGGQATDSPQLNDVDSSREASRQANYGKRGQQRKSFADAISELRRKWGRRGIVEIDKSHSRYALTRCIQQGLQESFKNCEVKEDASLQTGLTEEDFATVDVFQLTAENKKKFEFRTYAPKIFSRLRQVIGLSEKEYQSSLVPSKSLPYLEFISNSKSGMSFFLCNNKMMMIKTEKPKDVKFFRSILKTYLNHFEKYPHTLLVKILGLHYIHIPGHKARFFTIMLSVFYPDDRIVERYDLKGCHAARYTEPEPDGSQIIAILKDNNFKNKRINLGTQRQWFVDQVRHDTIFLEDIGVMDYSLLLGRHIIHSDERCQEDKFADVVIRVTKSVPLKKFQTAVSQVFCEACQTTQEEKSDKFCARSKVSRWITTW